LNRIEYTVNKCSIVILAAGSSSRFGKPKQLLDYNGKSLVQHAADEALQTNMQPVIIVVGANHVTTKKEVKKKGIQIVHNEKWQEGIASSLRFGLKAVIKISPATDGIIFMVCDQPYVTSSLLKNLLQKQHESKLPIVASAYGNSIGTPALFHKTFFTELADLAGDAGAKKLFRKHAELSTSEAFPKGNIDIDTIKDYQFLLAGENTTA